MPEHPRYSQQRIPVSTLGNGHELAVVVHRIEGDAGGPTIGITGGIHGDETDTVEYLRRFVEKMRETPFRGTVLAISCANPLAFESRTRNTPNDMIDLNRIFPGDPDGLLTQQLAHQLFSFLSEQCEYFVDFHCGGIFPTVDYVYVHGDEGLARSVGSRLLYFGSSFEGSLAFCLGKAGVKTTVIELGGGRVSSVPAAERALGALTRVLTYVGALEGEVEARADQLALDGMQVLRPHYGGMLISELCLDQLGTVLPKGAVVGRVVHPQTLETLEELSTPFDPSAVVLAREGFSPVSVGDYGFMFGHPKAS
ncbi:MAG TPA: M14 family metallopeptidase [Acidimicrobiales bacterium]|nr:M14 family metallopeptidase [Acidimicrobiales bacterium]